MCLHGEFKKASRDRAFVKIIVKTYMSTIRFFFQFYLASLKYNVVLNYMLAYFCNPAYLRGYFYSVLVYIFKRIVG